MIQSLHYFHLHGDMSITVWKAYSIGPGKLLSKETLDGLYTKSSSNSNNNQVFGAGNFPQGTTMSHFVSVGKDQDEFKMKHELSSRRKRQLKQEREERVSAKKQKKTINVEQADAALAKVVVERSPFLCARCDRRFPSKYYIERHICSHTDVDSAVVQERTSVQCPIQESTDQATTTTSEEEEVENTDNTNQLTIDAMAPLHQIEKEKGKKYLKNLQVPQSTRAASMFY
jgi:hypothetical protein